MTEFVSLSRRSTVFHSYDPKEEATLPFCSKEALNLNCLWNEASFQRSAQLYHLCIAPKARLCPHQEKDDNCVRFLYVPLGMYRNYPDAIGELNCSFCHFMLHLQIRGRGGNRKHNATKTRLSKVRLFLFVFRISTPAQFWRIDPVSYLSV